MAERKRMMAKFSKAGVRAIFAGHYHRNAGGHFEELELVVTSAMGAVIQDAETGIIGKSGYRVVDVQEDRIKHQFVEIEPWGEAMMIRIIFRFITYVKLRNTVLGTAQDTVLRIA